MPQRWIDLELRPLDIMASVITTRPPTADPGFSWQGRTTPRVGVLTYFFAENCKKIERIWTPRSATATEDAYRCYIMFTLQLLW